MSVLSWIIIHLIELTGGRASDIAGDHQLSYFGMLGEVFTNVVYLTRCLNILFVILMVISFIIINYIMIKKKLYKNRKVLALFISFVLSAIYIILLSAKTYTHYILRMEVIFVVIFYIFLFMCFAFAYVLKNYKKSFIIFPVLVLVMVFDIHTVDRTFRESNYANLTVKQNKVINERIVEQIKNADGKPGTVIYIPYFDHPINWPIPLEYVERIPKALYKHGVIDEYTELKFEINKDYYKDILGE